MLARLEPPALREHEISHQLLKRMWDTGADVCPAAADALISLAPQFLDAHISEGIIRFLGQDVHGSEGGVHTQGLRVLCMLNPADLSAHVGDIVKLVKALSKGGVLRGAAAEMLGNLLLAMPTVPEELVEDAFEALKEALKDDSNQRARDGLAQLAGKLVAKLPAGMKKMTDALSHKEASIRRVGLLVLARAFDLKVDVTPAPHTEEILNLLDVDDDDNLREEAVRLLGKLDAQKLVGRLDKTVEKSATVRAAAAEALGQLDKATLETHAEAILRWTKDSEGAVRAAAVKAQCQLDEIPAHHTDEILALLKDKSLDDEVAAAALEAIGKLKGMKARECVEICVENLDGKGALAGLAAWAVALVGPWPFVGMLILQWVLGRLYRQAVADILELVAPAQKELRALARVLGVFERAAVESPKLQSLQTTFGGTASRQIEALGSLVQLADSSGNQFFQPFGFLLMWRLQCAIRIEAWRRRCGPQVKGWLVALGIASDRIRLHAGLPDRDRLILEIE